MPLEIIVDFPKGIHSLDSCYIQFLFLNHRDVDGQVGDSGKVRLKACCRSSRKAIRQLRSGQWAGNEFRCPSHPGPGPLGAKLLY